ncbi:MAG: helix-turn-helix transcriptional regulator [Clostridia bacterium]|nr:helix-turn-helix transcriptional regulator [Clostridia bacterium]
MKKKLRKDKGLTIEELAKELNLTVWSVDLWERSKRALSLENLIRLAQYFNVSIDYLVGL